MVFQSAFRVDLNQAMVWRDESLSKTGIQASDLNGTEGISPIGASNVVFPERARHDLSSYRPTYISN
jgi:hypothetical protein